MNIILNFGLLSFVTHGLFDILKYDKFFYKALLLRYIVCIFLFMSVGYLSKYVLYLIFIFFSMFHFSLDFNKFGFGFLMLPLSALLYNDEWNIILKDQGIEDYEQITDITKMILIPGLFLTVFDPVLILISVIISSINNFYGILAYLIMFHAPLTIYRLGKLKNKDYFKLWFLVTFIISFFVKDVFIYKDYDILGISITLSHIIF
jgi:hypothetical protein